MTNTTHTPGPWAIDGRIENDTLDILAGSTRIAMIDGEGGEGFGLSDQDMEANARLIAAAPELLNAAIDALADLQGIMPDFDPSGEREHSGWQSLAELQSAIAKARGA